MPIYTANATQTVTFTSIGRSQRNLNRSGVHQITFTQPTVTASKKNWYAVGATQTVTFSQPTVTAYQAARKKNAIQTVTFTPSNSVTHGIAYFKSATQVITFTQKNNIAKVIDQSILFTQIASAQRTKLLDATDIVTFTPTISKAGSRYKLSVVEDVFFYSGGFSPDLQHAHVYFIYPFGSVNRAAPMQISLKRPKFGNKDDLNVQVVVRHSRNGDRYSYARNPTYEIISMDFDGINEATFALIQAFVRASKGQEIEFRDHKGARWRGVMLNDPVSLVNVGRSSDCGGDMYALSIDFEGERV